MTTPNQQWDTSLPGDGGFSYYQNMTEEQARHLARGGLTGKLRSPLQDALIGIHNGLIGFIGYIVGKRSRPEKTFGVLEDAQRNAILAEWDKLRGEVLPLFSERDGFTQDFRTAVGEARTALNTAINNMTNLGATKQAEQLRQLSSQLRALQSSDAKQEQLWKLLVSEMVAANRDLIVANYQIDLEQQKALEAQKKINELQGTIDRNQQAQINYSNKLIRAVGNAMPIVWAFDNLRNYSDHQVDDVLSFAQWGDHEFRVKPTGNWRGIVTFVVRNKRGISDIVTKGVEGNGAALSFVFDGNLLGDRVLRGFIMINRRFDFDAA